MKIILPLMGWLLFLVAGCRFVGGYGTRWTIGRFGVPASLLAPDGTHYLSGDELDPVTLALVRSGMEQAFLLGAVVVILALLIVLAREQRKLRQRQRSMSA